MVFWGYDKVNHWIHPNYVSSLGTDIGGLWKSDQTTMTILYKDKERPRKSRSNTKVGIAIDRKLFLKYLEIEDRDTIVLNQNITLGGFSLILLDEGEEKMILKDKNHLYFFKQNFRRIETKESTYQWLNGKTSHIGNQRNLFSFYFEIFAFLC